MPKVTMRKKQVVSLYISLELWEQFRLACEARETTRGRVVERHIKRQIAAWNKPTVTQEREE